MGGCEVGTPWAACPSAARGFCGLSTQHKGSAWHLPHNLRNGTARGRCCPWGPRCVSVAWRTDGLCVGMAVYRTCMHRIVSMHVNEKHEKHVYVRVCMYMRAVCVHTCICHCLELTPAPAPSACHLLSSHVSALSCTHSRGPGVTAGRLCVAPMFLETQRSCEGLRGSGCLRKRNQRLLRTWGTWGCTSLTWAA